MRPLVFFLLLLGVDLSAQDTVILKDNSRLILNVLHVTNDDVVYTKPNKDRSYFMPFSRVQFIYYRNGSKQNIDSIYRVAHTEFLRQLPSEQAIKPNPFKREELDEVTKRRRRRNILAVFGITVSLILATLLTTAN